MGAPPGVGYHPIYETRGQGLHRRDGARHRGYCARYWHREYVPRPAALVGRFFSEFSSALYSVLASLSVFASISPTSIDERLAKQPQKRERERSERASTNT